MWRLLNRSSRADGKASVVRRRMRVVFPDPFGPARAVAVPGSKVCVKPLMTGRPRPYRLVRFVQTRDSGMESESAAFAHLSDDEGKYERKQTVDSGPDQHIRPRKNRCKKCEPRQTQHPRQRPANRRKESNERPPSHAMHRHVDWRTRPRTQQSGRGVFKNYDEQQWCEQRLTRFRRERNQPDKDVSCGDEAPQRQSPVELNEKRPDGRPIAFRRPVNGVV